MDQNQNIDLGTTGAKVQTWEKHNARELLKRIVEEHQGESDEALFHAFNAECAPYFMEIVRYWFANNLRALVGPTRRDPRLNVDRVAAAAEIAAAAKGRVEAMLLDLVLPSGNMLRDSTFGECATAGGFFAKLAKKGQPHERVGAVLSEKEVRAVWTS